MSKAFVNGVNLHYTQMGAGPDIVMLHGLGANLAFWFLGIVPALTGEFRVMTYDMRGHGYSDMPASGYTSAHMAEDLHSLLNHLQVRQAHLVGHSFGGAVALHFAILYPERVASLTLADAKVRVLQPSQRLKDWPYWNVWKLTLQAAGVPLPSDEQEIDFTFLEEWAKPQWQHLRQRLAAAHTFIPFSLWQGNRRASLRWRQLLQTTTARRDFPDVAGLTRERISRLQQPTLAIFGQYSHCLETLRGLQESISNCKTVIIPEVGHFHPMVKQKLFVEHLRNFLHSRQHGY
jgi:pimeloyl-ACP methyl ester carboxylesterase